MVNDDEKNNKIWGINRYGGKMTKTVMFECLGCGKPIVGTKVGGVPEIITPEDYGLLYEPANSKLVEKF